MGEERFIYINTFKAYLQRIQMTIDGSDQFFQFTFRLK